ncbi:MAG: helix-turn-helix domain-containing protein [Gemmatimonadota bacterium]|nr:MAG: helix-turn-helix domain-containing protein [Gemmatimonadota bacterium]
MTQALMTVQELAKYLSLNEKKIYALIKRGDIPCTRITGKWLFPKKSIDQWIDEDIRGKKPLDKTENITIMGSHDLAIDILESEVIEHFPQLVVLSAHVGSVKGLVHLQRGSSHMAGIHLLDPETKEYNLPFVPKYLPKAETVVVHFLDREQGFMVQPGNPLKVKAFEDLTRPDVRFINRQEGAGTRQLLDYHLQRLNIEGWQIRGYERCVSTHTEVALAVRNGEADVGLGLKAAATAFGLNFIPITKERFDFVITKAHFYTEPIQEILEVIRSEHFRYRVDRMGGYDTRDSGRVIAW